jgi:4-hydroxy-4-methyl-2-oxoglutarate aldolase
MFHGGIGPLDSKGRGKMMAMDTPIACGGVLIASGDLIFGDVDGVVAIPEAIATEVIAAALDKISTENNTRAHLKEGMLLADVYARYGVL